MKCAYNYNFFPILHVNYFLDRERPHFGLFTRSLKKYY